MRQIGHAILSLSLPSGETEKYLITLPKLVIQGLLVGSPYIELSETSWIVSSTGWVSTVRSFLLKRRVSSAHSYCHFDTLRSSTLDEVISAGKRIHSKLPSHVHPSQVQSHSTHSKDNGTPSRGTRKPERSSRT